MSPDEAAFWGALGGALGVLLLAFAGGFIARAKDPRHYPKGSNKPGRGHDT